MSNNNLKTHYSAKELLELSLSCLPNSVQGIIYQAKKQGWESQKRVARGGGSEFALSSLPKEVQNEIYNKFTVALVQHKPNLPTVKQIDLENITTKQREIAGARMALNQERCSLHEWDYSERCAGCICSSTTLYTTLQSF